MSGGISTAEKYKKFGAGEYSSSDFERYVDGDAGLSASWKKIQENPNAPDSQYWIKKGATSKSAFGRAHAAEDAELYSGSYGDRGDTKIIKGTPEYDAYFGKYGGGTRFDAFNRGDQSGGGEESGGGSSSGYGGSGWGTQLTGNIYHPQLVQEYSRPDMVPVEGLLDPRNPLSYIGDGALYQPGTVQSAAFAPDGIVGYQPPELSVGMPRMVGNPYGSLELPEGWEELLSGFEEEEEEQSSDSLNDGGGVD